MAKRAKKGPSPMDKKLTRPTRAKSTPTNQELPGMEDRAIRPLEEVAASYAEVRDQRIALNADEHSLKQTALRLMKQHNKQIYRRNGIEIRIVPSEEDVKVKIAKPAEHEDDGEPEEDAGEPAEA
jgi:hypothetical protein